MKKLYYILNEKRFIKEMNDYTKIIIMLTKSKDFKSAHSYKIMFYAKMLGFIENITKNSHIDLHDLLIELNLDESIMYSLYNYLQEEKDDLISDSINYNYYKGLKLQYLNKKNVLNKLLYMHLQISTIEFISDKKNDNKNIKNKIIKKTTSK